MGHMGFRLGAEGEGNLGYWPAILLVLRVVPRSKLLRLSLFCSQNCPLRTGTWALTPSPGAHMLSASQNCTPLV